MIEISKAIKDLENYPYYSIKPAWIAVRDISGKYVKPIIICICGRIAGIGLHHVHADGIVTASFYHKKGNGKHEDPEGCEWHVFIKLKDYDCGEFLSVKE